MAEQAPEIAQVVPEATFIEDVAAFVGGTYFSLCRPPSPLPPARTQCHSPFSISLQLGLLTTYCGMSEKL